MWRVGIAGRRRILGPVRRLVRRRAPLRIMLHVVVAVYVCEKAFWKIGALISRGMRKVGSEPATREVAGGRCG